MYLFLPFPELRTVFHTTGQFSGFCRGHLGTKHKAAHPRSSLPELPEQGMAVIKKSSKSSSAWMTGVGRFGGDGNAKSRLVIGEKFPYFRTQTSSVFDGKWKFKEMKGLAKRHEASWWQRRGKLPGTEILHTVSFLWGWIRLQPAWLTSTSSNW